MLPFSIVIICKNEADTIGNTLQSLKGLTDDIVVYDNGSTDNTAAIIKQYPVQFPNFADPIALTKQRSSFPTHGGKDDL